MLMKPYDAPETPASDEPLRDTRPLRRWLPVVMAPGLLALVGCAPDPGGSSPPTEPPAADAVVTFYQDVAWSPDGEWLAVSVREISEERWAAEGYDALEGTQYDIHLLRPDGSERRALTDTADASELWAAWSPGGSYIAYVCERDGNRQIHVARPEGGSTVSGIEGSTPSWSPDGSQLAFAREVGEHSQVFVVALERAGESGGLEGGDERQLTRAPANHWNPRWSPDGSRILFYTDRKGPGVDQLWIVRADGTDERALTDDENNNFFASWSPDGAKVLFTTNRDGPESVWEVSTDGSGLARMLPGAFYARLSPDGRRLAFIVGAFPDSAVYVGDLHGIGHVVAE